MFKNEGVAEAEAARLRIWFATYCTVAMSAHVEHRNGLVDDMTLSSMEANLRWFIGNQLFCNVYEEIINRDTNVGGDLDLQVWANRIGKGIGAAV